jgi:hypothetical protein
VAPLETSPKKFDHLKKPEKSALKQPKSIIKSQNKRSKSNPKVVSHIDDKKNKGKDGFSSASEYDDEQDKDAEWVDFSEESLDGARHEHILYIQMEFCVGESLHDFCKKWPWRQ